MNRLLIATILAVPCFGMAQQTKKTTTATAAPTTAPTQTTTVETETTTSEPAPAPASEEKEDSGGLFVEPAVTYQMNDTDFNWGSFGSSEGEANGFGLGMRLGFHASEVFFVGMDARYSQLGFEEDSVSYDADAEDFNYGPVVGIQMPDYGMRVWATYVAGGSFDPDRDSSSLDVKFEDTTGYRVGVGFHLKSFSINAEYQKLEYDKTKVQQLGPFASPGDIDGNNFETEAWIGSVSFPIEM